MNHKIHKNSIDLPYRLSNFAVMNDGIIAVSINLSVALIAIWTTVVKRFSEGTLVLNHYICTGIDPDNEHGGNGNYQSLPKKYNSSLIVVGLCFLLHIVLWPKIFLYKRKAEKKVVPVVLGNLNLQQPNEANFLIADRSTPSFSPLRYV